MTPLATWRPDEDLTVEQLSEDIAVIQRLVLPEGVRFKSMEVFVNDRLWKYRVWDPAWS